MTLNNNIEELLNKQINAEFWSGYLYLSMSAFFEDRGLKGFAHWMKKQYEEEFEHGHRFFNYLTTCGSRVQLSAIDAVDTEWRNALDVFEKTYTHETEVTEMIYNILTEARKENDYATIEMLQWFVREQVEEESQAKDIMDRLALIGDNTPGLLMLDAELAQR